MSVKTTIKVVLRKAGDAWEATKEYSLLDYVIVGGQTQYVCRKVDAATGVNKGHALAESEWWEKCADAGEMAETLEGAVAELVASADEAADAANNAANSATNVDAKVDDHDVAVTDGEGNTATYPTATLTDVQVDGESAVVDGVASVPKIPKVWANVMAVKDCAIKVDGKIVELPAYQNVVIEDFKKVSVFCDSNYYAPEYITKFDIHNNGFVQNGVIYCNSYGQSKDSTKTYHAMSSLQKLNVGGIGLMGVKDCGIMFFKMSNLKTLDTSGWNTGDVTNMWDMFSSCSSLTSLDVSGFDTKNVTSMQYMFSNCSSLTSLDVSGFDTKNVTSMQGMFSNCSSLTSIDVSGFDTKNVTSMQGMFYNCSSLTSIDVSGFDTKNVTTMQYMFYGCSQLEKLDVSTWDTENVTNMGGVFFMWPKNNTKITSLDVSGWKTGKVTQMGSTFIWFDNLAEIIGYEDWDTSSVQTLNPFLYLPKITRLDLSKWKTKSVTKFGDATGTYMFMKGMNYLSELLLGEGWGTNTTAATLDLSQINHSGKQQMTDATWASMLTMYDRATAGLTNMTIKLHKNHNVPDGWAAKMTERGYTISY